MKQQRSRRGVSSGFTIIELMLVIAILGLLASIAVVAYQDYTKRTKVVELLLAASTCRQPVFEAYYFGKRPTSGFGCEQAQPTGNYVQSVAVDEHGKVSVTARGFGDDSIDGRVLTLTPLVEGDPAQLPDDAGKSLVWRCGFPADGTTINSDVLPSSCRGL